MSAPEVAEPAFRWPLPPAWSSPSIPAWSSSPPSPTPPTGRASITARCRASGPTPPVRSRLATWSCATNGGYNVPDLVPFAQALTDHADRRVVVELTAEHPAMNLNDAWQQLHGLHRPTTPTADDAVAVLEEMGLHVHAERSERVNQAGPDRAEVLAFARRRLCVGPEREAEIDALLGPEFESPLRRVVTLWWDGQASQKAMPATSR